MIPDAQSMTLPLVNSIRNLQLKEGERLAIEVDGTIVDIAARRSTSDESIASPDAQPDWVPWFDITSFTGGTRCEVRMGTHLPIDPPYLPQDFEPHNLHVICVQG